MFVYDWSFEILDEYTFIRIYGLDSNGETIVLNVRDFQPYFYLELPEGEVVWDRKSIRSLTTYLIENVFPSRQPPSTIRFRKRKKLYYAQPKDDYPYLLCRFFTNDQFRNIRNNLIKSHYIEDLGSRLKMVMHEANVSPLLQLSCEQNIPMAGWIKFKGEEVEPTNFCDKEYDVSYKDLYPSHQDGMPGPMVLSFDIECYSSNPNRMPKADLETDCVFQISCVFWKGEGSYVKYLLTLGVPDQEVVGKETILFTYPEESDLLIGFVELLRKHNPHVITGYNILGFDMPYLMDRAELFGLEEFFCTIGMVKDKVCAPLDVSWSSSAYGNQHFRYIQADGRIFMDLLIFVRREFKFDNYRLDTVASRFVDAHKDPITPKDIFAGYKTGVLEKTNEGVELLGKVGHYCVMDSVLVSRLFKTFDTWYGLMEMAKVCNVQASLLYTKGQQIKVFSQVYKYCFDNKIVVETDGYNPDGTEKYQGALVKEPIPGLYNNVVPFDFCLSGNTLISCSDGISRPLKTLCREIIQSYKDDRITSSIIMNGLQDKGKRQTVKIYLQDGETITSTPDHKFLCEDGQWREAQHVKNQQVVCGVSYPSLLSNTDKWSMYIDGEIKTDPSFLHTFVRILGYTLTDGSIYISRNKMCAEVYFGTLYDATQFMNDVEALVQKRVKIRYREAPRGLKGGVFCFALPALLAKWIHSLDGIIVGRPTQPMSLPSFLLAENCPLSVIQQFLSGMYGGGGTAPYLTKVDTLGSISFKWTTTNSFNSSMQKVFEDLTMLHNRLGIETLPIKTGKVTGQFKDAKTNWILSIPLNSIDRFSRIIGFQYCINKQLKLVITSSYVKYLNEVQRQNKFVCTFTNKLYETTGEKIDTCLVKARLHLLEKEPALHPFSLSSKKDIYYTCGEEKRHAPKPRRKSFCYKGNFPSFETYITSIGCRSWFSTFSDKKYTVGRQDITLPIFYKKVIDVRDNGIEHVYDIEVKDTHNFIANGVVAHNCSLYPSVIIAYNIDYSTLVIDDMISDDKCHIVEWKDEDKTYRYRFLKEPPGVIPTIAQNLLDARKNTRKEIKRLKSLLADITNEKEKQKIEVHINILNKRQLSYKISVNSMYGSMGVKKGYLPFMPGAMATTAMGRYNLTKAQNYLETKYKANVIYSDTDSCYCIFPHVPDPIELWKHCYRIDSEMLEDKVFPPAIRLAFEEVVYNPFLILSKKRYMYTTISPDGVQQDKIGQKGILLARRDNSKFQRDIYRLIVHNIFHQLSFEDILYTITQEYNKCCSASLPQKDFIITKSIKDIGDRKVRDGMMGEYKVKPLPTDPDKRAKRLKDLNCTVANYPLRTLPAVVQLAERMRRRGKRVEAGQRVEYVVTMNGGLTARAFDKIEDPEYQSAFSHILKLDYLYYIKLTTPPLDELIEVVFKKTDITKEQYKLRKGRYDIHTELKTLFTPSLLKN